MNNDDSSAAEQAEQIVEAEMERLRGWHTAALGVIISAHTDLAAALQDMVAQMMPVLDSFQKLSEAIERHEDDTLAALEDDFYSGPR